MARPQVQSDSIELYPAAPYNFDLALSYLASSPSAVLEAVDDGCYQRALEIGGQEILLAVRSTGTLAEPCLIVEVQGARLDPETVEEATRRICRIFALKVDPADFETTAKRDPILSALVQRFQGLRPVCIADPYEAMLWAIIGQQVNVSFARKLKLRLVELCGRKVCFGGREYLLLPLKQRYVPLRRRGSPGEAGQPFTGGWPYNRKCRHAYLHANR